MKFRPRLYNCLAIVFLAGIQLTPDSLVIAETPHELKPLLAIPDKVVLEEDFEKPAPLNKQHWGARMGTQWTIVDGVLRGKPSTAEYQASKKDHQGFEPRVSSPITPAQFVAKFSVRFSGGSETAIVPFVEFGHHVARIQFSKEGTFLLAEHDSLKVAEAKEFKFEIDRWYHALAELKGEEFVIQFSNGPTLYAKHASYAAPAPSGGNGLGVAGPKGGTAEIDNVTLWTILPNTQATWSATRSRLPKFEPILVKQIPSSGGKKAKAGKEE